MVLKDSEYILNALSVFNDKINGDPHFLMGIDSAKEIIQESPEYKISGKACVECRYYKTPDGKEPCITCSNYYISKFISI